jgi:3-hydroxyacyl-CoA dehydrogenase/enoyl-CoA hydratase/carnithine racemase
VSGTEFTLGRAGGVALLTIATGEDVTRPSVLGEAALRSLEHSLGELERASYAALVLTGKSLVFAAGADIDELRGITPEQARAGSRAGHELFGRLRALPYPTVAAINGDCLGGGVELALHCDARTISTDVRRFACPEVFLGIVPGWGGTQLVPRLVGPATAVKVVVSNALRHNRMLDGARAFELGFADHLLEPDVLLEASIALALELAENASLERAEPDWSDAETVFRRARNDVEDTVHGAAPAPYRALELIEGARHWSLEEGYRAEEDAIAELLPGHQAQASLYAFDLVERRAKRPPFPAGTREREVGRVGVVGAGAMGRQIATLFLRRLEKPVVLSDLDEDIVASALTEVHAEIERLAAKGRYGPREARLLDSLVSGSTSYDAFAGCDLVVEAVVEEPTVKREAFAALESVVGPECVLATNTSALSVAEITSALRHPERAVGLHFFNPVSVLPLVELVRAPRTDDATIATAWTLLQRLRKRGVIVRDAPGFVVNRVLMRMTSVLMDALEHGNTVEETDHAVLRLGLPIAPSVLLQMVGPQLANQVLETLHESWPDRFPLSPTLGNYAAGRGEIVIHADRRRSVEEVTEAVLEAVADEIHRLLDEGVVPEAADVDTCLLLGAGWPFFLGGITKHLDQVGISERLLGTAFSEL